ncbi:hypothetical protein C8R42DRAFT_648230 [Lentinula raphanica]|nr:hypothetical protein C8R42DRAFT_648230 [Lentinula raphanica]
MIMKALLQQKVSLLQDPAGSIEQSLTAPLEAEVASPAPTGPTSVSLQSQATTQACLDRWSLLIHKHFDVWVTFEFPPLISRTIQSQPELPKDSVYRLVDTPTNFVAVIKDGESTDRAPIVTQRCMGGEEEMWQIEAMPGPSTNLITITNLASTSQASAGWPAVANQILVGTRSPAVLNTTSLWSIDKTGNKVTPQSYLPNCLPSYSGSTQLIGTNSARAMDDGDNRVVLIEGSADRLPHWRLVERHLEVDVQ